MAKKKPITLELIRRSEESMFIHTVHIVRSLLLGCYVHTYMANIQAAIAV